MKDVQQRFLRNAHILARLVEHVLENGYLREATDDAVTFDQINIIKFLANRRISLVKDVAHFLNASYAAASKAVSRLSRKGMITTATSTADRRAEELTVTAKGKQMVTRYERLKAKRLDELLKNHDVGALSAGLEQTIAILSRDHQIAGDPCLGCGAYYSQECIGRELGYNCRADEKLTRGVRGRSPLRARIARLREDEPNKPR